MSWAYKNIQRKRLFPRGKCAYWALVNYKGYKRRERFNEARQIVYLPGFYCR